MAADTAVREHLIWLLEGGHAHTKFDDAVKGFPVPRAGERPKGAPYSAWELLEHMRMAQNDMLRFSLSADHVSPEWPTGYWPATPGPNSEADWTKSLRSFRKDLAEFVAVIRDPGQDLNRKFPWGDGQSLFREALQIADHNAYHLGQLVLVRRLLGEWGK
ncbi:MAG TPA: DinB family protein [Bryobacteraceae bacterium]|nr:DinB family protein [Bryobacteraceae bacterium]